MEILLVPMKYKSVFTGKKGTYYFSLPTLSLHTHPSGIPILFWKLRWFELDVVLRTLEFSLIPVQRTPHEQLSARKAGLENWQGSAHCSNIPRG